MAAPTQELPSWLSYSTSVATNADGVPTETFTTTVTLPLTYYGPSIPLGSDGVWVYGGLSSPPPPPSSLSVTDIQSTSFESSITSFTSATPTSLSAVPSTTSSIPSSTLTTSPSSTLTTPPLTTLSTPPSLFPSSPSSSLLSSSSSPSSPLAAESSHAHHAGVIAGSVLGSVVGSFLLLFTLICFVRKKQGQRRRSRRLEPPMSQVMWMWHDVHGHDDDQDADLDAQLRSPGDASAHSSGDEHDAFLRRSRGAANGGRDGSPSARLVGAPRASHDSSSPIGVALAEGSKAQVPSPGKRYIISPEQLAEVSHSAPLSPDFLRSPEEAEVGPDAPLLPPPTVKLDVSHGSRKSVLVSERSMTPGNDPESALLYTAQRVQVGQSAQSSRTTWAEGIGIPSILRRSWLNPSRTRSATPTPSPKSSLIGRQLTDSELEAGRSLNAQLRSEVGYREGVRPMSGVSAMSTGSARSGNTIFYDAQSREDLSSTTPPPPQGTASTSRSGPLGPSPLSAEPVRASGEREEPPAYQPRPADTRKPDDAVDCLDAPIPRPASPFASASSVNAKRLPTPLGLGVPDLHPAVAPSSDIDGTVNVELLEEPPPVAGENWKQMAQGLPSLRERRTTFGLVPSTIVYPCEYTISEQGSLHSMRSHVSPHSARSASGSAPASNSNSLHSRGFTTNSSLKSLAHMSSISSTDRRLASARRSPGEVSPPLSATGRRRSSVSPPHGLGEPSTVRLLQPPLQPHAQSATVTSTTTRSSVTTHVSMTDPVTGEVVRISHPAWTGGRDFLEEQEDVGPQPPPSSWGGSWTSPGHLHVLQNRVAGQENASHG